MSGGKCAGAQGFTLLELSIVLVLIGIIIGMGLVTMTASLQASQYNATVSRMDEIEKAILNYAIANNRIPCPADLILTSASTNYGFEAGAGSGSAIATATGVCTGTGMQPQANFVAASGTVEGGVPTRALQLPDDYMYDGWGRKFRYAVDPSQTVSNALPAPVYSQCNGTSASAITVNDASGAARTTVAAYALISHGANGHGAYTSNGVSVNAGSVNTGELANCNCTSAGAYTGTYTPTYVEKVPTQDASNALDNFDDIVTFKEPWQLQAQNYPLSQTVAQCVFVTDSGNNRVDIFSTSGAYVGQFGSTGSGNGQFNGPVGIAIDSNSNIWVVDNGNGRVQEFSSGGNYLSQFGTSGSGAGQFSDANGINFDASGNIWVVNGSGNNAVQEFNTSGSYIGYIGTYGSGNGQLYNPQEVRFISGGNLWVADSQNYRIEEFTSAGAYVNQFGSQGTGNGQFSGGTQGIAIDGSGNIWATDWSGCRVEKFNSSGTYVSQFGSCGTGNGQFDSFANDINIDGNGNIWVSSTTRVQKFDSNGTYLLQLGCASGSCSTGSGNGQFNSPNYIAFGH